MASMPLEGNGEVFRSSLGHQRLILADLRPQEFIMKIVSLCLYRLNSLYHIFL